jgi:hypothetical protein
LPPIKEPPSNSLGSRLAPLLSGGFFRPLSRPSAAIYIDCADRLMEAADEGGQIPHDEARLLIREVMVQHPGIQLEEDGSSSNPSQPMKRQR